MEYTQLDFIPYPHDQKSIFEQAQWLLHELVNDNYHKHPCDCGACIYATYDNSNKAKHRPYSKRTFFVYFLGSGIFHSHWIDYLRNFNFLIPEHVNGLIEKAKKIDSSYKKYKKDFMRQYLENSADREIIFLPNKKKEEYIKQFSYLLNIEELDAKELFDILNIKKEVKDIIKELEKEEKNKTIKIFLQGILKNKSFYTYYKRAGDLKLSNLIKNIRQDLMSGKYLPLNNCS